MTREKLKPMVEKFMIENDHDEKDLMITIKSKGSVLADYHIACEGICIEEKVLQDDLMISNMYADSIEDGSPDMLHIKYDDVQDCVVGVYKGECDTDVIADIMTLKYANDIEVELGFLTI